MAGPTGTGIRSALTKTTSWHPTVAYLLVLIVVEIGAYAVLRYTFRSFHGG